MPAATSSDSGLQVGTIDPAPALALAEERERSPATGSLASTLGHDLRNAVMPLVLHLDLLDLHAAAPQTAQTRATVDGIVANLHRLSNGLLLCATEPALVHGASALHLHHWWNEIGPLLLAPLPAGCDVSVRLPHSLPAVCVDSGVLAHVMLHLLVSLRLAITAPAPHHVKIAARRTNRGVSLSVHDGAARVSRPPSLGRSTLAPHWGMSLAESLLERTGGGLSGYSVPGSGTHVTLRLTTAVERMSGAPPAMDEQIAVARPRTESMYSPRSSTATASDAPRAALRILIIDDNAALTGALALRLGMEADVVCLPPMHVLHDAATRIEALHPTVVLLDLNLPGDERPLDVLRELGRRGSRTRVIVFTGNPSVEAVQAARDAGAAGFIAKGIAPERLIAALHRANRGAFVVEFDG